MGPEKRRLLLKRGSPVEVLSLLDGSVAIRHDEDISRLKKILPLTLEEKNLIPVKNSWK